MLQAMIAELARAHPWSALPQIVFINILLSGDNALIIAMACRSLPRRQQILGMIIGAVVAVVLLIGFAGIMARLLQLPYLKLAGGIGLLYIAARLLVPDRIRTDAEPVTQLWRAVRIIVAADLVMSFDNVLAIVQIAGGDLVLLAIGLAVSIPIVLAGAALITALLDRFPVLIWAGSVLLGWVAGQTIASDAAVASAITRATGDRLAGMIELAAGCAGAIFVLAVGGFWRSRRLSRERCGSLTDGETR
jgi:YjbE family integral membrane protein